MPRLTVLIPCKDERQHIAGCIESVRPVADDLLIADWGSTDGTREIVERLGGCRVIQREYTSAAECHNWALQQAKHDWVFVVEPDERLTPPLCRELRTLLATPPPCNGYALAREHFFLGHPIRHGGFAAPRPLRLFRGSRVRFRAHHDHAIAHLAVGPVGRLQHPLLHYAALDLDRYLAQEQRQATWMALDAYHAGKRATWLKMALHAPLQFLQSYVLHGGFRDGRAGLMLCGLVAYFTFLRDCKLWELNQSHASHIPPRKSRLRHFAPPMEEKSRRGAA